MRAIRSNRRLVISRLLLMTTFACLLSAPAIAVESFYERLFQDGIFADGRGEHLQAAEILRLACFGMLDEPEPLTRCLVRLAVAQAAAEDQDGFLESLGRMLEVERRFETYELARLSPEARNRFERAIEGWASYEAIADIPAFDRIAEVKLAGQIRQLDDAAARLELDRRIALEPDNPVWRLLAVELHINAGAYEIGLREANALIERHPTQVAARCFRGLARGGLGQCSDTAVDDLATCDQDRHRDTADRARIACLAELERVGEARALLASIPEARRNSDPYRRLARQLKRVEEQPEALPAESVTPEAMATDAVPTNAVATDAVPTDAVATDAVPTDAVATDAVATGPVATGPVAANPVAAENAPPEVVPTPSLSAEPLTSTNAGPSDAERQRLDTGWAQLRTGDRSVFPAAFESIYKIADTYPEWPGAQHLAAEFAYRLSRWDDAVKYFERADEIVTERPELQFYLAISLYKSGNVAAARAMLERCLPRIQRSDFVVFWVERIQATG